MSKFTYSARPATGGEIKTGELDVKSKEEVLAYLHRQKLIPVSVREKEAGINFTFGTGITPPKDPTAVGFRNGQAWVVDRATGTIAQYSFGDMP